LVLLGLGFEVEQSNPAMEIDLPRHLLGNKKHALDLSCRKTARAKASGQLP
jgi:hypothetical protein